MSDIEDCRKFVENLTRDRGEVMRAGSDKIAEIKKLREAIQSMAFDRSRIVLQRAEIERLREALRWYADPRNHFPVERRSPGDPDPAVIFVEEPPIMLDGGERARRALDGKP